MWKGLKPSAAWARCRMTHPYASGTLQVAFLASVGGPKVAAAAAQAALEALGEDDPGAAAELEYLEGVRAEAAAGAEGSAGGAAVGEDSAAAAQGEAAVRPGAQSVPLGLA